MNIGGRVKQRMDELGLTVPDVVARVPNGVVSSQALWALIKRDSIRSEFDVILAKTLGVSPIWLVYGDPGMQDPAFFIYPPRANDPPNDPPNVHQLPANWYADDTIHKTAEIMKTLDAEAQSRVYGYASGLAAAQTPHPQTNKVQ